ncbi:MAG: DUF3883 domain-containing protein [Vicinamibacterales bacterium]
MRLIEVKGIGAADGAVMLTPNEIRVSHERRDCFWLYVVSKCRTEPLVRPVQDPVRFPWEEVLKVAHCALPVSRVVGADPPR